MTTNNAMECTVYYINQASIDHVKVRATPFLALHNLGRNLHMFLDILELGVDNQNIFFKEKKTVLLIRSKIWGKIALLVRKIT